MISRRLTLLPLALLAAAGCVDEYRETAPALSSFRVEILDPPGSAEHPFGTPQDPIPLPLSPIKVRIHAQALGLDGKPYPFTGTARVSVTPGSTVPSVFPIEFTDGVAEKQVTVLGVHTDTRVWVIDDAFEGSSHAVGVGENLRFDQPTLAAANAIPPQGDNNESFYPGDFVEMTRVGWPFSRSCERNEEQPTKRDLIVTAITSTGFYVTDLAEPASSTLPGNFGNLFVFNFSYPDDLQPGDRISRLQGTLVDFSGNTQLAFPNWSKDSCDPDVETLATVREKAPAITTAVCTGGTGSGVSLDSCGYSASNMHMESLESALVQIPEVQLPEMWVRCDFDGDGNVATFVQSGSAFGCLDPNDAECACNLACATAGVFPAKDSPFEAAYADRAFDARGRSCTERTSYESFGQYVVRLVENGVPGPRINLQTRDAIPDFDPAAEESLGARVKVHGILGQVRAARPRWVISTHAASDLCCLHAEECPSGLSLCD